MSLLGFTSTLNMGNEKISQNSVSTNSQLHHDPGGYCDFIFFEKLRNRCHFWGSPALSICGMKRSRNSQLHHDPGDYCDFIFFEKLRNRCHFWGSPALSICGMKRSRKIASPPTRSFIMIRGIIATLFFSRNWEIDVTFGVHQHSQYGEWKDQNSVSTNSHSMIRGIIATLFFSRNWEIDVTFGVHQHSQYGEWKDLAK